MSGFLNSPFLKGDLGRLLSSYLITPCPPLEKGGKNSGFKCHSHYEAPHWAWERLTRQDQLGNHLVPKCNLGTRGKMHSQVQLGNEWKKSCKLTAAS